MCDGVCVKKILLISIPIEWYIWFPSKWVEMSCVSAPFWRIGNLTYNMMHFLAQICLILISAKIYNSLTVCFVWVALTPLLGVDCVSSSYRVIVLHLLIVLIYWDLVSVISWVHVLIVWTPPPVKGRTPSHVGCVARW